VITAEQFEREYAERCKMPVERLRLFRTVRPCDCGDEICKGWQSVSHEEAAELDARQRSNQPSEVSGE
jgi:hypothetical protein